MNHIETLSTRRRYITFILWKPQCKTFGSSETIEERIGLYLTINDPFEFLYIHQRDISRLPRRNNMHGGIGMVLLSETDDHNMRLLTVLQNDRLPTIKDLPITFRQAQITLNEEWARTILRTDT